MNISDYIHERQKHVDALLKYQLNTLPCPAPRLQQAVRYVLCQGGKRLRPVLIYAVGEFLKVPPSRLDTLACSIEYMHSYSLVHDDLPAMDDADFRRGQPACHKVYGDATAILVGDALQLLAIQTLSTGSMAPPLSPQQRIEMISILCESCGIAGMIAGQQIDLEMNHQAHSASLESLYTLHQLKTGRLFEACVRLVLIAANETLTSQTSLILTAYAKNIGLAFQIQDDLQDKTGSVESTGKSTQRDQYQQKATFVTRLGVQTAQHNILLHYENALLALNQLSISTDKTRLHEFTYYMRDRAL